MKVYERLEDELKAIETRIIQCYHDDPEITDHNVDRALEAAMGFYKALSRQQTPKPHALDARDTRIFEAIQSACEWRLGHRAMPPGLDAGSIVKPVSLEDILACLKRLRKSVDFWTKEGGRRGYLEYVEQFIYA